MKKTGFYQKIFHEGETFSSGISIWGTDVKLVATAGLFSSIGFLTDLIQEQRSTFKYVFDVKMEIAGFRCYIHDRTEGNISLAPER